MYRLKIIQYKGEFSIRRILDASLFTKNSSDFNSFSSPLLPSCVNSARHNTRINKKIKNDQKTVEYEIECTKARQMYVHKKEVQKHVEFSKNSSFFFNSTFDLVHFPHFMFQILFVTPHFYTYVKFVCIYRFVAYLFDADSTDPDAWRNISFEESKIFSQFHPFANPSL